MIVKVKSVFDCTPSTVWNEVQTSKLLMEIIAPVLRLVPVAGKSFPDRWSAGMTVVSRVFKFGFLPLGRHTLRFERVDHRNRQIQTREHSWLMRRWDHLISVGETLDGRTQYTDVVELDAGLATPLVWLFAQLYYRHRHRRWRRIVRRLTG